MSGLRRSRPVSRRDALRYAAAVPALAGLGAASVGVGTPEAAAKTIWDQNILGGMCARVCPTEQLCEEVCVRELAEGKPVEIGRLQRFATDRVMEKGVHPFTRAASSGKRVAVVGAGPAGLACAHRLALHGHDVVVMDRG